MLHFLKTLISSRNAGSGMAQKHDRQFFDRVESAKPSAIELIDAKEHFEEGNRQLASGDLTAAERGFRSAIAIHYGFADAHCNLGSVLKDQGDFASAEQHLQIALLANPKLAPALFNLAMLYVDARRWADAAPLLRTALAQDAQQADAQYWLGNTEMGIGSVDAAQKAYAAAVRIDPQLVQARWGAAMATIPPIAETVAEQTAARQKFQAELNNLKRWFDTNKMAKGHLAVGAQQPYYLAYIAQNHRETLSAYGNLCVELMSKWSRQIGIPTPAGHSGIKYRIGIVSAHIHSHSVWHALIKGWVEHLDPKKIELHLFHTGTIFDSETAWASRRVAAHHHSKGAWTEWAKLIAESNVDALIYPEIGMDATTTRLASLRLARVQLASWGHPITTGLPTMDYFISSQGMEPMDCQDHYTEKLLQLPRLGSCYQPIGAKAQQPDIGQWNITPEDRILLCAGTPFKYSPEHDDVWPQIVRQCCPCKLVFFKETQAELADRFEQRLRKAFAHAAVDFDSSVRFIPWQSRAVFFGLLDLAHVYLDTLGFSGFNTTMQAIERNTPVVAFEGQFMRGRFASAILHELELHSMVATSSTQFVQITANIVQDENLRQSVKSQITQNKNRLISDKETVYELGCHLVRLCG